MSLFLKLEGIHDLQHLFNSDVYDSKTLNREFFPLKTQQCNEGTKIQMKSEKWVGDVGSPLWIPS